MSHPAPTWPALQSAILRNARGLNIWPAGCLLEAWRFWAPVWNGLFRSRLGRQGQRSRIMVASPISNLIGVRRSQLLEQPMNGASDKKPEECGHEAADCCALQPIRHSCPHPYRRIERCESGKQRENCAIQDGPYAKHRLVQKKGGRICAAESGRICLLRHQANVEN